MSLTHGQTVENVLRELIEAIDAGHVKIDGPRVFPANAPGIYEDDEHVLADSWPWADEWLSHARAALASVPSVTTEANAP